MNAIRISGYSAYHIVETFELKKEYTFVNEYDFCIVESKYGGCLIGYKVNKNGEIGEKASIEGESDDIIDVMKEIIDIDGCELMISELENQEVLNE